MYLLDTNVCIRFLNKRSKAVIERLSNMNPDDIFLCSIVKAELYYGAFKSNIPDKSLKIQKEFCSRFNSLYFDDKAAEIYGKIRATLEKNGQTIGPNDLIIASIAVANGITLVTHNCKEFNRVQDLIVEDWESNQ